MDSLKLFRIEQAFFIAASEQILNVLTSPNDLTEAEKEFWLNRVKAFNDFAIEDGERINKLKEILDAQAKARNAWLN